jgi:hypothetical protein
LIEIPHVTHDDGYDFTPGHPGWFSCVDYSTGRKLKPIIRCNCGRLTGIGLHHVHVDGTVTASYYHKRGNIPPEDPEGCGWHVFLKLLDYDQGDFPSVTL